jgi:YHS domain-containing protein
MLCIELFAPRGALSEEERDRVAERLVTELMTPAETASAPAEVVEASLAMWHVVVHEPSAWAVGGRCLADGDAPPYLARVTLPEAWLESMSALVIERVGRVLDGAGGRPPVAGRPGGAWVWVVGVGDGTFGTAGGAIGSTDLVRLMTEGFRTSAGRERHLATAAPGTSIDPICGMAVPLARATITAETEGVTVAFCSEGCRQVFLEDLATRPGS